ncbi:MAG: carbohydrate kinase family protein [Burkholderiaceae bacterium]|jgi:fructokinase
MFAVCGEALFDVFATGTTSTGLSLDARIGGSPFNVAVGLARLGQPVSLVTVLSEGFLGQRLLQALVEEGVDTGLIQRSPAPTTLSVVGVDAQGVPSYAFYGEQGADRLLDPAVLDAWPDGVACVHVGSYATVMGATATVQRSIVERARARSLIAYDPNIRLNVQPSLPVWRDQVNWMLPRTHLLKVSEEDLGLLYPGQAVEAFAQGALAAGVSVVVVTGGAEGARVWASGRCLQVPPVPVSVVDTVGAGDTFQAALLTWLAEHGALSPAALSALGESSLNAALRFASEAAAITCGRRGADMPRRFEVPTPTGRP